MVFRSIVVPVTAALGYVLSIGAAFGLTSLVFVDGFLAGAAQRRRRRLGRSASCRSSSWACCSASRWTTRCSSSAACARTSCTTASRARAVDEGFVGSARVVTAAAIIMFAVFAAFVPDGDASIQPIAFGLAVGVAIDAFLVRMTLIPAVLVLFGRHAWWIPAWLDRVAAAIRRRGRGARGGVRAGGLAGARQPASRSRPRACASRALDDRRDRRDGRRRRGARRARRHGGRAIGGAARARRRGSPVVDGRLKVAGPRAAGPGVDGPRAHRLRAPRARRRSAAGGGARRPRRAARASS